VTGLGSSASAATCAARADPVRVARHLVDDVGVPAVLGFHVSKEALDLTNTIFQPRGILALAGNQSTMLSNVARRPGEPRMLFRVSPSAGQFAEAMMAVVNDVWEPELRANGPLRLAVARVPNTTGVSYADVFLSKMKLGGVAVAADPARFRQVITPVDENADDAQRARAAREILEMRPHLVVVTGGGAWLADRVEKDWPADLAYRPRWVELGMLAKEHAAVVAARPDLRGRMIGVDAVTSHPALAKYVVRYREAHGVVPPLDVAAFPYDAFYLFAYLANVASDPIARRRGGPGDGGRPGVHGGGHGSTTGGGAGGHGAGGAGGWELSFDSIALPDELIIVTEKRFIPGTDGELLVLEKGGRVSHLRIEGDAVERLGEFQLATYDVQDCGLMSLAFGPDFEDTGDSAPCCRPIPRRRRFFGSRSTDTPTVKPTRPAGGRLRGPARQLRARSSSVRPGAVIPALHVFRHEVGGLRAPGVHSARRSMR